MLKRIDLVLFTFRPTCECEGLSNVETTVEGLLEVGTPLCPYCDKENEIEDYCQVEEESKMTKYTPGPWIIERHIKTAIGTEDKHIAMVNYSPRKISEEEHEANAYLIAAAPDMLELLVEILGEAEDYMRRTDDTVSWAQDARRVVNKAKGEYQYDNGFAIP